MIGELKAVVSWLDTNQIMLRKYSGGEGPEGKRSDFVQKFSWIPYVYLHTVKNGRILPQYPTSSIPKETLVLRVLANAQIRT